jgi:hypothetical protein
MRALLTSLHTRFPVHCLFEQRSGFGIEAARSMIDETQRALEFCAYTQPLMRSYYPLIDANVCDKHEPGLQVADMLLWSLGQLLFEPKGKKACWAERCGIFKWADAEIDGEGIRWVQCTVNAKTPSFSHEHDYPRPYPFGFDDREPSSFTDLELANFYASAERFVRRCRDRLPIHAWHLTKEISEALSALESPNRVGRQEIRLVARAFLHLFDTVPLYNGLAEDNAVVWQSLLRTRHFLSLVLLRGPDGDRAADFLAQVRRDEVGASPRSFGLP